MSAADHPAVQGKPLVWLRVEGLSLLAGGIALFATTHQPWWLVPVVILLPDLFMAGYVGGPASERPSTTSATPTRYQSCCR